MPDPEVFPEAREWLELFLEEHENFTAVGDEADDQVDASVNAHTQLGKPPVASYPKAPSTQVHKH